MNMKLTLGMLLCIPAAILFVGCSEIQTAGSVQLATAPMLGTDARVLQVPGGPVVLRDVKMVRSLEGSDVLLTCEVDWVARENGLRRIVIDGTSGSVGSKEIALYDMDANLKWRMGWESIGADSYFYQESSSERLETLRVRGPSNQWQETYTHRSGDNVRQLVLAYNADSPQDRAEARREYLAFMPRNSTSLHNEEGERLVYLLQDPEFYHTVQRANGEEPTDPPEPSDEISEVFDVLCDLLRQCTSTACADGDPSPACLACATGAFICWIFGM